MLRQFVDMLGQPRLVTGCGVLVDNALVDHLIDQRYRRSESFGARSFIAGAQSGTKLLDLRTKLAAACAIDSVTFLVLPNSLFG